MQKGRIVVPNAGKDQGKRMAVLSVDEHGVYIVNGREHPLDRPKRKNPRHLIVLDQTVAQSDMETNRTLRRALAQPAVSPK